MRPVDSGLIFHAIEDHAYERFGDEVMVSRYGNNNLLVTVRQGAENPSLVKFGQVMYLLAAPQTWYYRPKRATELEFESALVRRDLPLTVVDNQRMEVVHRPPEGVSLKRYVQGADAISDEARLAKQEIFVSNIENFLKGKPTNAVT